MERNGFIYERKENGVRCKRRKYVELFFKFIVVISIKMRYLCEVRLIKVKIIINFISASLLRSKLCKNKDANLRSPHQ